MNRPMDCGLSLAALSLLLSSNVAAATLASQCGAVGIVTYDPPPVTETRTTPAPVPYAWLRDFYPEIADEYDAYEAAALAPAANGVNPVWECYVAGISPTDPAARFLATISMDTDGTPHISHLPPLSAEEEAKREFRILGKRTLAPDEDWADVTDLADSDAAGYRFFKATVRMRE